jgi:serine/threonine protein kinase
VSDIITIEASTATAVSSPHLPASLRRFGKYHLIYRFASGGMANLYLGRLLGADGFERLVAIKIIHDHLSQIPEFTKMFVDEARLISRIFHPNVVQVIDLGKVARSYFIAMEYVDGESVAALLRRTRPPLREASRIVAHTAAGLHAAHELQDQDGKLYNVVHRDVSPHNILVAYNGAVKVVDFGVARARGSLHTTKDATFKGKYGYMAPEQVSARSKVDRRADIFALGIVLWEMTMHKRLFCADTDAQTVGKVLECSIPRPSELVKDYPEQLEAIVLRALQPNPDERYQTAMELQEDLELFISDSGDPVLQNDVGKLMGKVFTDRIKKKKKYLDRHVDDEDGSIPEADLLTSLSDRLNEMETVAARRRRILWIVGAATGLAAALVVLLAVMLGSGSDPAAAGAPAKTKKVAAPPKTKAEPAAVTVKIVASPVGATLTLDGKPVDNPYSVTGPPQRREVKVVASASGHVSKTISVDLAQGGRWVVDLSQASPKPEAKKAPDPTPRRRRRGRGRRGGRLSDDDVLANPYGN